MKFTSEGGEPVTLTTDDGEVYEIPDLPAGLGRATALASEETLKRLWDSQEEDAREKARRL